ncbi:hypothetical protein V6W11_25490 [Micromonospora profundi]|uniref:hypothetical protein n=1 Tax=Micromonospora profundi TaxID=1420889 RepID=UPI002FF42317
MHVEATPIRFDVTVPGDLLDALTWRNRRGEQRTLKYVVDGRFERSVSLQGVYRLTDESAARLGALLDSPPAPTEPEQTPHVHQDRQPSMTARLDGGRSVHLELIGRTASAGHLAHGARPDASVPRLRRHASVRRGRPDGRHRSGMRDPGGAFRCRMPGSACRR